MTRSDFVWCVHDKRDMYSALHERADVMYNHFAGNNAITTKAGLAATLERKVQAFTSLAGPRDFFPQCYSVDEADGQADFWFAFMRSAASCVVKRWARWAKTGTFDSVHRRRGNGDESDAVGRADGDVFSAEAEFECRCEGKWPVRPGLIRLAVHGCREMAREAAGECRGVDFDAPREHASGVLDDALEPLQSATSMRAGLHRKANTRNVYRNITPREWHDIAAYASEMHHLSEAACAAGRRACSCEPYDSEPDEFGDGASSVGGGGMYRSQAAWSFKSIELAAEDQSPTSLWSGSAALATRRGGASTQLIRSVTNVAAILETVLPQWSAEGECNVWVVKPGHSSRGVGVELRSSHREIMALARQGRIVQRYIERPLLIEHRKFDMRVFVLVTSWAPLQVHLFDAPYLRRAAKAYGLDPTRSFGGTPVAKLGGASFDVIRIMSDDAGSYDSSGSLHDPLRHLCNHAVQRAASGTRGRSEAAKLRAPRNGGDGVESPTSRASRESPPRRPVDDMVLSHARFVKHLCSMHGDTEGRRLWFDKIMHALQRAVVCTLVAAHDDVQHRDGSFELFGFDFLIDDTYNPWLLEVNLSPALNHRTPYLKSLLATMTEGLVGLALRHRDAAKTQAVQGSSERGNGAGSDGNDAAVPRTTPVNDGAEPGSDDGVVDIAVASDEDAALGARWHLVFDGSPRTATDTIDTTDSDVPPPTAAEASAYAPASASGAGGRSDDEAEAQTDIFVPEVFQPGALVSASPAPPARGAGFSRSGSTVFDQDRRRRAEARLSGAVAGYGAAPQGAASSLAADAVAATDAFKGSNSEHPGRHARRRSKKSRQVTALDMRGTLRVTKLHWKTLLQMGAIDRGDITVRHTGTPSGAADSVPRSGAGSRDAGDDSGGVAAESVGSDSDGRGRDLSTMAGAASADGVSKKPPSKDDSDLPPPSAPVKSARTLLDVPQRLQGAPGAESTPRSHPRGAPARPTGSHGTGTGSSMPVAAEPAVESTTRPQSSEPASREDAAASVIQTSMRARRERQRAEGARKQHEAATRIQAINRGKRDRERVHRIKRERAAAATKMQAIARGRAARVAVGVKLEEAAEAALFADLTDEDSNSGGDAAGAGSGASSSLDDVDAMMAALMARTGGAPAERDHADGESEAPDTAPVGGRVTEDATGNRVPESRVLDRAGPTGSSSIGNSALADTDAEEDDLDAELATLLARTMGASEMEPPLQETAAVQVTGAGISHGQAGRGPAARRQAAAAQDTGNNNFKLNRDRDGQRAAGDGAADESDDSYGSDYDFD